MAKRFVFPTKTLSLLLGVSLVAPTIAPTVAAAQLFRNQPSSYSSPSSSSVVIPSGVTIPVRYDEAEKIFVTPEETVPLTLTVAANIRDSRGNILIPYGSQIIGQIEPAIGGGSRFVAQELYIDSNRRQFIDAASQPVTRTETIRRGASTGDILQGVAAGAAAATIIAAVTGDNAIATEEVLGGAGLGALGGWLLGRDRVEVVSIDPNRDLDVVLRSRLALNRY